jgi:hypothetical protein
MKKQLENAGEMQLDLRKTMAEWPNMLQKYASPSHPREEGFRFNESYLFLLVPGPLPIT